MNKEDALRIRDILHLFDYESANLTEDQWAAIEEIEDIIYKPEYDQTPEEMKKELEGYEKESKNH